MSNSHLQENLRLLCSYGKSTSDICRQAGFNRQQFNKYLNGHAQPSLATLRRVCDFFGVDDHEILLPHDAFKAIIRLRPPNLGVKPTLFENILNSIIQPSRTDTGLLERHEGYYHVYLAAPSAGGNLIRSLVRLYRENDAWLTKTVERYSEDQTFISPTTVKYSGIALEAVQRITVLEREEGSGRSLWATMLFCSDQQRPSYLSGLCMMAETQGRMDINCVRTVWHYLGSDPNLRQALQMCGSVDQSSESVPDIILECTDNSLRENEPVMAPRG
ncbi:helix-turn-helix transcriptional regulator [uncultured Sulfitobacter sp.]|uniref:helix-turn-helix domain-containing protein n=1 Tax=uncultured Sulfitobacter sp. TaxID=191468 RepID=UPI00260BA9D1|nr:helix-turn-helix transcriptional regulator [uncultured Sulfitobacter sp.]